jgi:hypothetical protein
MKRLNHAKRHIEVYSHGTTRWVELLFRGRLDDCALAFAYNNVLSGLAENPHSASWFSRAYNPGWTVRTAPQVSSYHES